MHEVPKWETRLLINGALEAGDGVEFSVDNPATAEVLTVLRGASIPQVGRGVDAAASALGRGGWRDRQLRHRCMHRLADVLETRADDLVAAIVTEVGTPISLARSLQVGTAIETLRWFADAALVDRRIDLGPEPGGRTASIVDHHPIGVVAAITAYNYPLLLAIQKIGAAFAAGCSTVLLPSPQAPLTTLLLAQAAVEAEFPPGVLNVLVGGIEVGRALTTHPGVAKVTFTGSVAVGREIMQDAAGGLRSVVLELGGKSPAVVLPEADFEQIVEPIHTRYLRNAGQGCSSPTRIFVPQDRYDEFAAASRDAYDRIKVGDPWAQDTIVGPVISARHRDRIQGYVDEAVGDGAEVLAGGEAPKFPGGWWAAPTLVGNVANTSRIASEEIFGPVAVLLPYRDVEQAIELANQSSLGLAAAVWGPLEDAMVLAGRLEAGSVSINGAGVSRPDAPLAGWKDSGIGAERGEFGIHEFLVTQHVQWPVASHGR